jgi:hypothetical protein
MACDTIEEKLRKEILNLKQDNQRYKDLAKLSDQKEVDEPEQATAAPKTRGTNGSLDMLVKIINFALVFGCSPSVGINADSKFMKNACENIERSMNARMTVIFPDCLESMQGEDCNFELATSSTLKPLHLVFAFHIAAYAIGYVFVQEKLNGLINGKKENCEDWKGTELTQGGIQ